MLVFRRQSRFTGHRCKGPQIYSMPTDVYIYESRRLKVYIVTYSKVKRINRGYVTHYTVKLTLEIRTVVVVVVVFFTLTDRASTIPSTIRGYQSGTWSQRGTKVNGSHRSDNPLLRPTGIQIATKSNVTLQAMAPTNNKTVHQASFTPYREQPRSTRIVVAYPRPAFSATNRTNTFQPVLINNSIVI